MYRSNRCLKIILVAILIIPTFRSVTEMRRLGLLAPTAPEEMRETESGVNWAAPVILSIPSSRCRQPCNIVLYATYVHMV